MPFCPECVEHEFGHRIARPDRADALSATSRRIHARCRDQPTDPNPWPCVWPVPQGRAVPSPPCGVFEGEGDEAVGAAVTSPDAVREPGGRVGEDRARMPMVGVTAFSWPPAPLGQQAEGDARLVDVAVSEVAYVDLLTGVGVDARTADDGERERRLAVGIQPSVPLGQDGSAGEYG
jgi:hypothetical protein